MFIYSCSPFRYLGFVPAALVAYLYCLSYITLSIYSTDSEIGAHVLSGNVFDPKALKELLPDIGDDWTTALQDAQSSHATPVSEDKFLVLSEDSSYSIPNFLLPSQLHNDGNYVISLGQLCRWLGGIAEEMGVEVYPGFAASEVVFDEDTYDSLKCGSGCLYIRQC